MTEENLKLFKDLFRAVGKEHREMRANNPESFFTIHGFKFYVNSDASYITVEFGKKEFKFHDRLNEIDLSEIEHIDDRTELLIVDAFEGLYDLFLKTNKKERQIHIDLIDKLFKGFVKRRKIKVPDKAVLSIRTPVKKYI